MPSATLPAAPMRAMHGFTTAANDRQVTAWALAARDGDRDAVDHFIRATYRDVRRFVLHLSADPHGCEDLAQETYLRALTGLSRFAGRSSARTWLLSIARRVVVDRYRMTAARPRTLESDDWQEVAERAQPVGLPGFDEGVALMDLLAGLAPARREMFLLTTVLGLPYADAATATGCPIGTVRSRVARAREEITALLAAAEKAAEPVRLAG